jgi:antitoxin ParD1/3/4
MATMNISLPDSLKEWAETQVASGKFANMSDFVRDLMRDAREQSEFETSLLVEINRGLASPSYENTVDELFDKVHAEAQKKLASQKSA